MESDLKVHVLSDQTTIASYRNVLIAHFRGVVKADCRSLLQRAMDELVVKNKSVVFFAVIEAESPPPEQAARQAIASFFEANADKFSSAVIAYRGEGFRAAMVRTVVSGILNLTARVRFPFAKHVVGSPEEAASLALQHSPGLDTAGLLAAFSRLAAMRPPA